MTPDTTNETNDLHVSRYEYDDRWIVAVDVGTLSVDDGVTVELVDSEAVVAVDTPALRTEFDLELPDNDAEYALNNGILVIEGER